MAVFREGEEEAGKRLGFRVEECRKLKEELKVVANNLEAKTQGERELKNHIGRLELAMREAKEIADDKKKEQEELIK